MPDFRTRSTAVEIMDDLDCNGEVVHQTLRELEFINRWLGGNTITLNAVMLMIPSSDKNITIADLGCGGGDMLKMLALWGRKSNIKLQLFGFDANPHIVDFARKNCAIYPEISFEAMDIFSAGFAVRKFDIILGTLFFHHFESEKLGALFAQLKNQVGTGIVFNDIHRHWFSYYAIKWLTFLFSKSNMVKFDAPLSVLRAFSKQEIHEIMKRAGIKDYHLRWRWAFRWEVVAFLK